MVKGVERAEILGYLEERFGLQRKLFAGHLFFKKGRTYWLIRSSAHLSAAFGYQAQSVGMPFMKLVRGRFKPTTRGLQIFGPGATKSTAELSGDALKRFIAGEAISAPEGLTPGYVVVRAGGMVLGCGMVIKGKKGQEPQLISQVPKAVPLKSLLDLL